MSNEPYCVWCNRIGHAPTSECQSRSASENAALPEAVPEFATICRDVVTLIESFPGYGTVTNLSQLRLKDQPAWVRFYNAVSRLPSALEINEVGVFSAEQTPPSDGVPVPLADHDDIGRKVLSQPWQIQRAIVTIAAHCTVLTDEHPTGMVADIAGCISQCCLELANALSSSSSGAGATAPK